ncbi:hypothetical protein ABZP36_002008 [Zizania latifolia]
MASFPETAARKLLLAGGGAGAEDSFGLWELVKAKATEVVVFLAGLLAALAGKAETLFPPGARSVTLRRWVHVAVMVALPAVVGALAVHCLGRCCCAAAARRREGRRMMVAPAAAARACHGTCSRTTRAATSAASATGNPSCTNVYARVSVRVHPYVHRTHVHIR